jgi:hypothetical protein
MRQVRCRIGAVTITAPNYGLELVPGRVVDLDQRLPNGGVLADQVQAEWFEPLAPEPTPLRRPAGRSEMTDLTPASPATEEDIDG